MVPLVSVSPQWDNIVREEFIFGVQIADSAEILFKIPAPSVPLANSALMSTLTVHCRWEDETVRERGLATTHQMPRLRK